MVMSPGAAGQSSPSKGSLQYAGGWYTRHVPPEQLPRVRHCGSGWLPQVQDMSSEHALPSAGGSSGQVT